MPEISVIMPCYNSGSELKRVLSAYEQQDLDFPFEIIAVDDGSDDATYQILTSFTPRRFSLKILRLSTNQGPAAARNVGIQMAESPILLFVGDDILPSPGFLHAHLNAHRINPELETAILGHIQWDPAMPQNTLMKHIDGIGAQQFSYYYMQPNCKYDFRHFYTANISLKKKFLMRLDRWFDTTFPYAAFEDVELAYRLTRLGLQIIYVADCVASHSHYHTIWSFSERQYRAGMMAWWLIRKYPQVARWLIRKEHKRAIAWYLLRGWTNGKKRSFEMVSIETNLLHFLSFYEWFFHPLIDALYLRALDYFYFKGLIKGALGESHRMPDLLNTYANLYIIPTIHWFLREARIRKIPVPFGEEDFFNV